MASISEIKAAIKTVMKAEIPDVNVYGDVPDVTQLPAVVVLPARSSASGMAFDFNGAMGRGLDTLYLDLYVLVARSESTLAQQRLDQLITGTGPRSLRRVFYENHSLGLDETDAHAEGIHDYGGKFATAGIDHIGAVFRLTVRTSSA